MSDNDEWEDARRLLSAPATGPRGMSRRRFLQALGLGGGAVALGPMLSGLEVFAAPPLGPSEGVLVLVMLSGGNDGLNTLVPYGDGNYYARRTHGVAIPAAQLLRIDNSFALHPRLAKLKARYDQGTVAFVRGIGYDPPDLSHFTSMAYWMSGWYGSPPLASVGTGWIGRYLDGLPNAASESLYGVVVGTSVPLHMIGSTTRGAGLPTSIGGAFGTDRVDGKGNREPDNIRMFDTVSSFGAQPTGLGLWGDAVAKSERDTMDLATRIQPAYTGGYPSSSLGRQLVLSARLINANLGIRVLSTEIGGFDNHSGEGNATGTHANLLGDLDDSIDAFFATLSPEWASRTTLMTFSEFGRRPEDNGDSGTDHGTASVAFLAGAGVRGGMYGTQPGLRTQDLDGNDNLRATVDFRTVFSEVLERWLRADPAQVLGKTYAPLGLFASAPKARAHRAPRVRTKTG